MQALFTGGLGDFIGAESFMTEAEKDAVTTVLWATRNRKEIQAAFNMKEIFPNLQEEKIMFDDWSDERPTRPWQSGDRFMNIGMKNELNLKCGLNLSQADLDAISDHSLDATLQRIFAGHRWQSSRCTTVRTSWGDVSRFKLPQRYVAIHPWSDAEINGREFNDADWANIFKFLETIDCVGVIVNQSYKYPPIHPRLIHLTNLTTLKETWSIIAGAEACILCASSLACFATKIFPKDRIWLKGGHDHMFSDWATYFYHGPHTVTNEVIFRNFDILNKYRVDNGSSIPMNQNPQSLMLDHGLLTLL
jgi:hypothetical protein